MLIKAYHINADTILKRTDNNGQDSYLYFFNEFFLTFYTLLYFIFQCFIQNINKNTTPKKDQIFNFQN